MTEHDPRFEALYRRHAASAFRRARRLLGDHSEAHEVVQDVFLSLLERPEQYAGASSLSTFLYSAVTHACLNRLRNYSNRARLLNEQRAVLDLQVLFCSPELRAELAQVLERMPEQLAHVAIYYFVDELPHRDIARIIGCSSRHVGDLVQRVLQWASRQEPVVCTR